jgi:glycosyltransferase involved in cell wall biosynthesis
MTIKIMYLIDVYKDPYAGTEKQLFQLIDGLDRNRFSPALTLFRPSEYIEKNDFPCPVDVLDIQRLFSPASLLKMIAFARRLRKDGYRLVHIFFNDASLIAPPVLKAAGIRVIISRRDMGFWYTPGKLAVLRLNRLLIDAVVVNSEAVKRVTHEQERISPDRIRVIYNGYAPDPHSPNRTIKLQKETRKVGIVANIRPVKRIEDLVRAIRIVRERYSDTVLVIVGSGDQKGLKTLASSLGIEHAIQFLGAQTNVMPVIRQFDVAVLCSESEGLSNAIIEYMQAGVPVVCTDTGGNSELVTDGETGYLVPVGDIQMLAERISTVLDAPERAAVMAERAFARVAKLCNMDTMLAQHARLYRHLLESKTAVKG